MAEEKKIENSKIRLQCLMAEEEKLISRIYKENMYEDSLTTGCYPPEDCRAPMKKKPHGWRDEWERRHNQQIQRLILVRKLICIYQHWIEGK